MGKFSDCQVMTAVFLKGRDQIGRLERRLSLEHNFFSTVKLMRSLSKYFLHGLQLLCCIEINRQALKCNTGGSKAWKSSYSKQLPPSSRFAAGPCEQSLGCPMPLTNTKFVFSCTNGLTATNFLFSLAKLGINMRKSCRGLWVSII